MTEKIYLKKCDGLVEVYEFFWIKDKFCLVYKCRKCEARRISQKVDWKENKWEWVN